MSSNRTAVNAVTCVLYMRPAIYRLPSCVLTLQLEPSAYRAGLDIILPLAKLVFQKVKLQWAVIHSSITCNKR